MDDSLVKYFGFAASDLRVLSADIGRIAMNKQDEIDSQNGFNPDDSVLGGSRNMKSLQTLTNFRHDEQDAKIAENNPEITFMNDQLNKILNR